jgi:hypothetical protein
MSTLEKLKGLHADGNVRRKVLHVGIVYYVNTLISLAEWDISFIVNTLSSPNLLLWPE